MNPQEAQQAQTIAETSAGLRSYIWARYRWSDAPKELSAAANLIDSQAQKIAEARECAERMKAMLEQAGAEGLIDNDADLTLPWGKP